jgi:hypothetical protein
MGISALDKIKVLGSELLDSVLGAEQPKMYYDPKGKIKDVLEKLPQLKKKYRPTPWLSNTHVHLLYFDIIRKKQLSLNMTVLTNSSCKMVALLQLHGMAIIFRPKRLQS